MRDGNERLLDILEAIGEIERYAVRLLRLPIR